MLGPGRFDDVYFGYGIMQLSSVDGLHSAFQRTAVCCLCDGQIGSYVIERRLLHVDGPVVLWCQKRNRLLHKFLPEHQPDGSVIHKPSAVVRAASIIVTALVSAVSYTRSAAVCLMRVSCSNSPLWSVGL